MNATRGATASEQTRAALEIAGETPDVPIDADLSVVELLTRVKRDVGAVGKTGVNKQQGYSFRGVDGVVNAVGPALAKHGVVVMPLGQSIEFETYTTKGGTTMRSCVVKMGYRFYGPRMDYVDAEVFGESSDAGDKSTPKAQSVAYRVGLLQALTIPTDEPDPDETSHERAVRVEPVLPDGWKSWDELAAVWNELKAAKDKLTDETTPTKAEVDAWVTAHGITRGTFTVKNAEDLRNLLPAEPS